MDREKRIKIFFRKNLKMTAKKLAAQCVHAGLGLKLPEHDSVVVLEASDKKFFEIIEDLKQRGKKHHIVIDAGRTEVPPDTQTCVAFIEFI